MKQIKRTRCPVVLTVKGKAAAVVQDAEAYQRLLDIAATASAEEGIRQGFKDVKQGKVRLAREFFADSTPASREPHSDRQTPAPALRQ
jgi:PHD/YefM family antitoxin component YafN of YafNO toxin-antitoxin module